MMTFVASVHAKAAELTRLAVEMTTAAGSGHPTSASSLAHIVTILLYDHMRIDPSEPSYPAADRLVLSEGHACPILYAAAADLGIVFGKDPSERRPLNRDDILTLRELNSPLDGHPNPAEGFPFFPAATGSLGQGLSIAAGIALSARLDGISNRIFCLIGDGESREGQITEALDFLVDYELKPVCPIFNCNGFGQSDQISFQQGVERLGAKLEAAGFNARVIDGHQPLEIRDALEIHAAAVDDPHQRPVALVARTVKGWGFNDILGSAAHGKAVDAARKKEVFSAIDRTAADLSAQYSEGDFSHPKAPSITPPSVSPSQELPSNFAEAARRFGQESILEKEKLAPRKAFGFALKALGHADPRVVALDGDVRNSTFSEKFLEDPELQNRFFECKIAEQNMVSCACGLASEGKIPFVSTFGKFLVRAYDQVEMGLIGRFPLKLVGSHVGASIAADGPSQMALTDVAFFRALSEVRTGDQQRLVSIFNPSDAFSAYALTLAMIEYPGACYLRTMRPDVPFLYDAHTEFHPGGHQILNHGDELLLAATGYMVHVAVQAMEKLSMRGVKATLVDLYSLPLEEEAIAALARKNNGRVVTVEDHYGGSFGSAVADALAAHGNYCQVKQMYVRKPPKSARTPEELLRYLGLSADDIVNVASRVLEESRHPVGN